MSDTINIIITALVAIGFYAAGRFHGLIKEARVREELAVRNTELELLHAEMVEKV